MTVEGLKKILTVLFIICFFGTIILTFFDATYNIKEKLIFSLIYLITVPIGFWILYKIGKFLLNNEVIRDGENREREGNIVTNWFSCKI
ncbi:hypothetical protein BC30052_3374 [Bacillus cereus]|uniref:hypothetical protein n=1 Tax=Bacillus cereus TaxID=1396 RepID=UPI001F37C544|nr:hypothetical protein [Bacillus cereus]BCD06319.1 hypothetical protein BC30052_3374 [Bacillus cereus]